MQRFCCLLLLVFGLLPGAGALGADWPQFRYDAGRTAAAPDELPATLHLQWTRRLPAPRPAFPGEVRLRFDASYEPVVLGKTLFVPSMVTDSVTALDTETGEQRWQFFAEGPVRFAPVAWQDKVAFVSDDGHLYCVDAASGQLRWKFQGRPPGATERKILGNHRLVSLWPAWGGPVLQDGVLYFGCGLWSKYGVCVHALNADSGAVVWSNTDSNLIPKANMDHGIANEAGLTPQGYLAVVNDKLVVPCGAQLPAFLDLKTGKPGHLLHGLGRPERAAQGNLVRRRHRPLPQSQRRPVRHHPGERRAVERSALADGLQEHAVSRRVHAAVHRPDEPKGPGRILAAGFCRRRDVRQRPRHRGLRSTRPQDRRAQTVRGSGRSPR